MIRKYRKKPVEIRAIQYDGDNHEEIVEFAKGKIKFESMHGSPSDGSGLGLEKYSRLSVMTLEGEMLVSDGDYVIEGVEGEFYPCKPNIFNKTYDKV